MALPIAGSGPVANDNAVTQDQVSDHPSKATNTSRASQGGHDHCAVKRENVAGTIKHGQHFIVMSNDMLADNYNSSFCCD